MPSTPLSLYSTSSSPAPYLRDSRRKHAPWTHAMDTLLMSLKARGTSWNVVAKSFPGKKANACRKRHERCMKRRKEASWDKSRSLERIAIAYANTRQNMWSELLEVLARDGGIDAKKLGWERLEAKCMKHGIKALMTAARCAERKNVSAGVDLKDDQTEADELVNSIMADDEEDSDDEDEDAYDSSIIRTATASTFGDSGMEIKDESSMEDTKEDSLVLRQNQELHSVYAANVVSAPTHTHHAYSSSLPVSNSVRRLREEGPRTRHTSYPPTIKSMLRSPSPSPEVQTIQTNQVVAAAVVAVEQKADYKREVSLFVRA